MKKKLLITLALSLMMGTGAAFAANPFTDVPANHWAYKSVAELQKAGLVDGYGDGTYKGERTITRYEMAQIVAKASARSDKADAATRAQIEKLQTEFAAELQNLGVKVDNLKAQVDAMPKFGGEARVRWEHLDTKDHGQKVDAESGNAWTERSRITMTGKINDNWTYNGRFENTQALSHNDDASKTASNKVDYNLAWVQGKVGENTVKAGRFSYMPVYGLVADSTMKGLSLTGGKDFTYGLYYGRPDTNGTLTGNSTLSAVEIGTTIENKVNLKAGLISSKSDDKTNKIYEVGGNTAFGDIGLTAAYAKSNQDVKDQDKAMKVGLTYKGADKTKPGSFGADVSYQKLGTAVGMDSTLDVTSGYKGYKLGADYTIDKNMVFKATYIDQKEIANSEHKNKTTRGEFFFYF